MWQTVGQISTVFSLAAFLASAIVYYHRRKLVRDQRLIEALPEDKRAMQVQAVLDRFSVRTEDLTREQRHGLASKLLEARAARFRMAIVSIVVLLVVGMFVALYAYLARPVQVVERGVSAFEEGTARFNNEEWERAIKSFSKVPSNDRNNWKAKFRTGLAHWHLGDYEEALKSFRDLEATAPTTEEELLAQYNIGRVLMSRGNPGDYKAAADIFLRLVEHPEFNDDSGTIYNASVLALKTERSGKAAVLLERFPFDRANVHPGGSEGDIHGKALVLRGILAIGQTPAFSCDSIRPDIISGRNLVRDEADVEQMFRQLLNDCSVLEACGITEADCALK